MAQTIQELLADQSSTDRQATRYLDTVQAYDQWAEVCIYTWVFCVFNIEFYFLKIEC
jgi:hypothetical protein